MDSFPSLPLSLRSPGQGAIDAAFVGDLNADRESNVPNETRSPSHFFMRKRNGKWQVDTPRSPDFFP